MSVSNCGLLCQVASEMTSKKLPQILQLDAVANLLLGLIRPNESLSVRMKQV